jgi:hypothetical protein
MQIALREFLPGIEIGHIHKPQIEEGDEDDQALEIAGH